MMKPVDVAIIGAGPYGLSLAAHLRESGLDYRIFGKPMQSWRENMPADMLLKSEGFASNLDDPSGTVTLERFCAESNLPYAHVGLPVPLSTLVAYGLAFQQRMVPALEDRTVESLDRTSDGFVLHCADDETVHARGVVLAVGMTHCHYMPAVLAHLPPALASHSSAHRQVDRFRGQDVTVIGGGASALDLAAFLKDRGAQVRMVVRAKSIHFNPHVRRDRPLWQRLRYPESGIGFGVRARLYCDAPTLFHYLPPPARFGIVRTFLGPSGGFHVKDRIVGRVPVMSACKLESAREDGGQVNLRFAGPDGSTREFTTQHVIAATGYRPDVQRLPFLSDRLKSEIRVAGEAPALSASFESSVPGLYFIGLAAANSFGPVMRFMFGASFTARRLSRRLLRNAASRQRIRGR
jgi:thioredoxin reductase